MEKLTPLEYGKYYHIYNRGINRQKIFFEERNYHFFLKRYAQYIHPIVDTYAYCLLGNHFHFLVRIKTIEEQLAQQSLTSDNESESIPLQILKTAEVMKPTQQFSNFFNSYAKAINKSYNRTGSLFEKHFGRIQVDSDQYFMYLVTYIHRNPQKHGFVKDYQTYPFSSYHAIRHQKNSRLKVADVLDWFSNVPNFENCHTSWHNEQQIAHLIGNDFD